ncbi:hypothetical protein [Enterococcus sp. CWB-B31]|uniref:hypothetical protein n=1 Tax=Enterococcus sp. CWB-B31 TaxID=2885159 RepID=UPI001E5B68B6|nr:hypothetical protein [Enterococcus sp. CWB-B31]MCB5953668.1 hypothetical protein [Enterococcus sp. CWB-B31]
MSKKIEKIMKRERKIPTEVMEKLVYNQEKFLTGEIEQNKKNFKMNTRKKGITILGIVAALLFLVLIQTSIGDAIEQIFGISKDSGVATVENNMIPMELDLISSQNGREIKLTKFVSTKQKFAFDYQFKLDDEQLKILLEKQISTNSNFQDIDLGLFINEGTEDIFGGGDQESTFYVEGDTFYGSVIFTYTKEKIPENADLTLHIYKLAWQNRDEYDAALNKAIETNSSFNVPWALQYEGDWSFTVAYEPLTQTAEPRIIQANNISDINAESDALQTNVEFVAPTEVVSEGLKLYTIEVYKNGVQLKIPSYSYEDNNGTTKFSMSIDLSALDKASVYKIIVSNADDSGHKTDEIGTFELQNG